ncbi:MAG: hypothetical protein AAF085_12085 [Planctomycetota bacterium]
MARVNFLNVLIVVLALAFGVAVVMSSGCTIATPFEGPGYEDGVGVTLDATDDSVIVVITQAVLSGGDREGFNDGTRSVMDSMDQHEGLIAWSVRREIFGDNAWTMTVWKDEVSLKKFVTSKVHRGAVKEGMPAVSQTRFYTFDVPAEALPISWDDALAQLELAALEDADQY